MQALAATPENKVWTYADYLGLPDDKQYQIIDGELFMAPAPYSDHQRVSRKLAVLLIKHVEKNVLGEVFYAPFDVILDDQNVVQPDILLIEKSRLPKIRQRGLFGRPDLAMEIVSPSSTQIDRRKKHALYESCGVPEYWVIDPANRTIEIFVLAEGQYQPFAFAAETGSVKSNLLSGFEVDLTAVMPPPPE
jgi:Uma2 family endonuclease